MSNKQPKEHNRVCEQGKKLGREMARLTDLEVTKFIKQGEWTCDERCESCAFRIGTVPNGCLQTQMDILKAVLEHEAFFCHMPPAGTKVCSGWFAAVQKVRKNPKIICPWPYSPPDPSDEPHA